MKLSELTIDVEKRENGEWVRDIPDMEGLALKVRGLNNNAWRKLQDKLLRAVPRHKRLNGGLQPEDQDRINGTLLLETVLLDWEGLENDEGGPLPYSKGQAAIFLKEPQFERFRDAVMWAAAMVHEKHQADKDDAVKN